jgi:hypothetical protein
MWKFGMALLIVCLIASIAIAVVRLATTPTEILGDGFRGLTPQERDAYRVSALPYARNAGIRDDQGARR